MDTLSQWEREAKDFNTKLCTLPLDCIPRYVEEQADRILALIDLVRKKDEALKAVIKYKYLSNDGTHMISTTHSVKEALALTEELK